MKTNRGFTLAELLIVLAIVGVFLAVIFSRVACVGETQTAAAKSEARSWARELGLQTTGVACANIDSDGDGYVSCTIALKDGSTKQIECRGAYAPGHGCREPKLRIPSAQ